MKYNQRNNFTAIKNILGRGGRVAIIHIATYIPEDIAEIRSTSDMLGMMTVQGDYPVATTTLPCNYIHIKFLLLFIIYYTSIDGPSAGISAMARRRRRFGESALTTVFYQKHF